MSYIHTKNVHMTLLRPQISLYIYHVLNVNTECVEHRYTVESFIVTNKQEICMFLSYQLGTVITITLYSLVTSQARSGGIYVHLTLVSRFVRLMNTWICQMKWNSNWVHMCRSIEGKWCGEWSRLTVWCVMKVCG